MKDKIYFVSDCHFGVPDKMSSLEREKTFVRWLDSIKADAKILFLLGDIFDFWFEYKHVVPKGYIRLLGKLAELSDTGTEIRYFTGNHDMWVFDYFEQEMNFKIYRKPVVEEFNGKKFFLGHGDGLGPGDKKYHLIKWIYSRKINQKIFAFLHPYIGSSIAQYVSKSSRLANGNSDEIFLGEENERLIVFAKEFIKKNPVDYIILGHRHLPADILLEKTRYINLGEWINKHLFAVFDGKELTVSSFE